MVWRWCRQVGSSATWGLAVWSCYATGEYLTFTVIPLLRDPSAIITPASLRANAVLLLSYAVIGCLAGAVAGLGLVAFHSWKRPPRPVRALHTKAVAAMTLVFANLVFAPAGLASGVAAAGELAMAAILLALIVTILLKPSPALMRWVDFNPWILCLLLLGPSGVVKEATPFDWPMAAKALLSGIFGLGLVALSIAARRLRAYRAGFYAASAAMVVALLMGLCVRESQAHSPTAGGILSPLKRRAPNVVLVTMDTTRADHLSVYGYGRNTTPYLMKFANEATVYTQAWAASDFTLPSHASIFTGVYPSWHGAHPDAARPEEIRSLDGNLPTLAGILAKGGYRTLAVAANSNFLSPMWGLDRGFQIYDVKTPVAILNSDLRRGVRRLLSHFISTAVFESAFLDSGQINQDVFRLLHPPPPGRPFLLFVNYMDAHVPYGLGPESLQKRFPILRRAYTGFSEVEKEVIGLKRPLPNEDRAALISDYDRGIAYEDDSLLRLFEWLKEKGLYDNTLIIVTADHGEAFGEHHLVGHGTLVYNDEISIPLLIKYPGQRVARRVTAPVSQVDLLPTVLDCLGFPPLEHPQGRSLLSADLPPDRSLFAESFPLEFSCNLDPKLDRVERAMRRGSMKLIVSSDGHRELYDLASDPDEGHDLYAAEPARAERLFALFRDWESNLPRRRAGTSRDDEMVKRLKSLGYLH